MRSAYDANATTNHDDSAAMQLLDFDVTAALPYLRTGSNLLIVQGLNDSTGSSDFLVDAELVLTSSTVDLPSDITLYTARSPSITTLQLNARLFHPTRKTWSGKTSASLSDRYPSAGPDRNQLSSLRPHRRRNWHKQPTARIRTTSSSWNCKIPVREPAYLVGLEFVDGIEVRVSVQRVLEPGEYGVLVKDREAFTLRYGDDLPILGEFDDGSLNNGGETLRLQDAVGRVVIETSYGDSALWPARADGVGGTLQLIDPELTPARRVQQVVSLARQHRNGWLARYRRSSGDSAWSSTKSSATPILRVTDPDSIELLNVGSSAINIGGWYLSDSAHAAASSTASRTVSSSSRGSTSSLTKPISIPRRLDPAPHHFSLNGAEGDDVWLTIADGAGEAAALRR